MPTIDRNSYNLRTKHGWRVFEKALYNWTDLSRLCWVFKFAWRDTFCKIK